MSYLSDRETRFINYDIMWRYFIFLSFMIRVFGVSVGDKTPHDIGPDKSTPKWPEYRDFGQISGVGVDSRGRIYVFHRGNREWNFYTFQGNVFADKDKGPIPNETVVVLDTEDGSLITKAAANYFYLPHGLTVDSENHVWLTDVAMHQVFKLPPLDLSAKENTHWKPSLILGTFLEPGNDDRHFCKPTSVAVDSSTKEFYVSDGYCNARVIKYDSSGKKLLEWGRMANGVARQMSMYMLSVPHSLALDEKNQMLYVADREHFRVLSYDSLFGKFSKSFASEFRSRIFSVAVYDELMFALANNDTSSKSVLVYNIKSGKYITNFTPMNGFTNPHDLAISPDGEFCYVVELKPHTIWKIKIDTKRILYMNEDRGKEERLEEPVPAESKVDKRVNLEVGSSFLAVGLVVSVVVISFLFFMFHYYKKRGYRRYETRRLILDDDEGGIQLT